ncbi:MAG TPA: hypothetical protein VGS05_08155 [Candidatus Sulfotelmatobacter sp.]|nr:hypothetical protein [Candidatus Sulfotelmatobacter sp.]
MRIRATFPIALAVVLIAAALTLAVQLRKHAPPEPARLLPSADAFLYANFSWARKANNGKSFFPVPHDPEYDQFIEETGFDYERDLDAVAFAVHYPQSWPGGGTGGSAPEPRFSEVFVARFDAGKVLAYLKRTAESVENYRGVNIFTIPLAGRKFRIAILGVDIVAASNHDDPAVIRGMVDRSRRLASPFGGPAMLRHFYKRVQLASPVWVIAHVDPAAPGFDGWNDFLPHPADIVLSASYNPLHLPLRSGVLHVRAEAWTSNSDDAKSIANKVSVFLSMFHSAEASVGSPGTDADLKTLFDSLKVSQQDSRAVLVATLPTGVFRKLVDSGGQNPALSAPPTAAAPEKPGKSHAHIR